MSQSTLFTLSGTSPAAASTAVVGSPALGMTHFDALKIVASLVGATGGTLDIYLQWTPDAGTTWYDYAHFTQLASGGAAVVYTCQSLPGISIPTAIGAGTSPVLAANTCVGGVWGNGLRCLAVAGSSTSAGAAVSIKVYAYKNG